MLALTWKGAVDGKLSSLVRTGTKTLWMCAQLWAWIFLKSNKGPPSLRLCSKPLADVEVFSNVSPLVSSWEASAHFLPNPENCVFLQTSSTYRQEGRGEKGASSDTKRPQQLCDTGLKLKWFLWVFIFIWAGLGFGFYFIQPLVSLTHW